MLCETLLACLSGLYLDVSISHRSYGEPRVTQAPISLSGEGWGVTVLEQRVDVSPQNPYARVSLGMAKNVFSSKSWLITAYGEYAHDSSLATGLDRGIEEKRAGVRFSFK